jgi:hypothetical protein
MKILLSEGLIASSARLTAIPPCLRASQGFYEETLSKYGGFTSNNVQTGEGRFLLEAENEGSGFRLV